MPKIITNFEKQYEALYGEGSAFTAAGVEVGLFRVVATAKVRELSIQKQEAKVENALSGTREVYWHEIKETMMTSIYDGNCLHPGMKIEGPAIVEMPVTTIVIRPGMRGKVDEYGSFIIEL